MSSGQTSGSIWKTLLVDLLGRLRIFDEWEPHLEADVAANDSDKTIAVPASYEWLLQSIYVEFTSTATAGNRQLTVEIQDGSANVIAIFKAGIVQAASITRYYQFSVGVVDLTSFRDTAYLTTPITELLLDEDYDIRVYDSATVDAAADDMEIQLLVKQRAKES